MKFNTKSIDSEKLISIINKMYIILILFLFESHLAIDVKVNTTSGLVRGNTIQVLGQTVDQYLGIPYAEPPIGELRFAKPKPISTPSKVNFN